METEKPGAAPRVSIEVPEDPAGLSLARGLTRTLLECRGVATARLDDCLLAVGELCANASKHGHSNSGIFVLELKIDEQAVQLRVTDFGPGFDPEHIPPAGAAREDGRIGGFGIPLVRTVCDRVEWQSGRSGTTVEAWMSLQPRPEAALPEPVFDETLWAGLGLDLDDPWLSDDPREDTAAAWPGRAAERS